ncbi:MAG: hypothetical protein KDD73_02025 [Anaerolineales bacterium]|nr:hypothetical protein [Anaerolineales bacterium]MCB9126347.1 hypothetical protein [Ardenticatenales bacterium]
MPAFNSTWFILGCIGGLLPDVLRLIKSRYDGKLPDYFGTQTFWLGLVLLVLVGGAAAWLGGANSFVDALAIGFAAPEFVSRFLGTRNDAGTVRALGQEPEPSKGIRQWWGV